MAVVTQEQPRPRPREARRWIDFPVAEVAASITISVIWLTVLLDSLFGPDIHSSTPGGTDSVVPSGVVVAICALIASWVIARHAFRRDPQTKQ
jgi:hypothetical protein